MHETIVQAHQFVVVSNIGRYGIYPVDDHGQDNSIELSSTLRDTREKLFLQTSVNSGPGVANME